MLRRLIFNLLLVVTALLLIIKPLVGFNLYHRAKLLAVDEFITVIKAFSKRKQDYVYEMDKEGDFICQQSGQNSLHPILVSFSIIYTYCANICTSSKVLLRRLIHKSGPPIKLYLLYGRLAL